MIGGPILIFGDVLCDIRRDGRLAVVRVILDSLHPIPCQYIKLRCWGTLESIFQRETDMEPRGFTIYFTLVA